jgi:hypothetical protein
MQAPPCRLWSLSAARLHSGGEPGPVLSHHPVSAVRGLLEVTPLPEQDSVLLAIGVAIGHVKRSTLARIRFSD